MDITSYLLGKNASGGGGGNNTLIDTSLYYSAIAGVKSLIKSVDIKGANTMTSINKLFYGCTNLETVFSLDTSLVTDMTQAFYNCQNLKNIPILNTSKVTNFTQTFSQCGSLTDQSLDNILKMCINATSYTGTKTLETVGITSRYYSASRIEALPSYQAFLDAGWTIGY